jgi:hypothetical protein
VTIENLQENYPKFFKTVKEEVTDLRYLLVVDENYDDEDSEEHDAIDPEDFNYLVYITDLLQESIGEKNVIELVKKLKVHPSIEDFYLSDVDLYGIQTNLNEEEIAHMLLGCVEELV